MCGFAVMAPRVTLLKRSQNRNVEKGFIGHARVRTLSREISAGAFGSSQWLDRDTI
jgi:hypothetical protein